MLSRHDFVSERNWKTTVLENCIFKSYCLRNEILHFYNSACLIKYADCLTDSEKRIETENVVEICVYVFFCVLGMSGEYLQKC